jgi:hypothetical protein
MLPSFSNFWKAIPILPSVRYDENTLCLAADAVARPHVIVGFLHRCWFCICIASLDSPILPPVRRMGCGACLLQSGD